MSIFKRIFDFYYQGFKEMKVGKKLWLIILIKLFILFAVLRLFFFPNFLKTKFSNDKERGDYVIEQLTNPK
jgi:flagellar basal body-associated protein FliL